jgi:hypothetical protein
MTVNKKPAGVATGGERPASLVMGTGASIFMIMKSAYTLCSDNGSISGKG